MDHLSDEELLECFRKGGGLLNDPYLNELFSRNYQKIACLCLRYTGNRDSALDLAQEVFASAYEHLDSFRGNAKFSTWLYAIARNQCINAMRTGGSPSPREPADSPIADLPDVQSKDPLRQVEEADTVRLVRKLLDDHLDETEKKVLTLHYVEETPLDAITRLLGLTNASGAKAYIVSARRKLKIAAERWKAAEQHRARRHHEQQSER